MSDTEQRQRVKPGDVVQVKENETHTTEFQVLRVHGHGIEVHEYGNDVTHPIKDVVFVYWEDVALPEPPKAKPGVRYRGHTGHVYVGLVSGEAVPTSFVGPVCAFNPEWEEA